MNHIFAFSDQSTCRAYRTKEDVPEGSVVFESPEDMARILTIESMDRVRRRLLGHEIGLSSSREDASRKLWETLSIGVDLSIELIGKPARKLTISGTPRIRNNKPIELMMLTWERGKDKLLDQFKDRLPLLARQMVDFLVEDGRRIWTGPEFSKVIMDRGHEMVTRQGLDKVIKFHRMTLYNRLLIRRISFVEFAASERLAAIAKANKSFD